MLASPIIIGENIHASRVVLTPERKGKKTRLLEDGRVGLVAPDSGGERLMILPDGYKETPEYTQGKIKHVRAAVELGMMGDEEGLHYLQSLAQSQIDAGASFLDVNVDEISPNPDQQINAMSWTAKVLSEFSSVPLSIDSSNSTVLETGLESCDRSKGRLLINSASLERLEVLDLAVRFETEVVISAFGGSDGSMTVEDRLNHLDEMLRHVDSRGIERERVHLDPLVFSVGTDPEAATRFLETVRQARSKYGDEIHITGGLSNISFGVPARKLLNEVFFLLALEAGCDSAIIDPLQLKVDRLEQLDRESEPFRLACDVLTGKDQFCMEYLTAYREGLLKRK